MIPCSGCPPWPPDPPRTRPRTGNPTPPPGARPGLAALGPAIAEIRVLVDVGLVEKDHEMPIALGAIQHALELLDEGLPSLRAGPAQQLLGFLPRQLAAVQGRTDRLAA